jgi:hypothetical protein
MTPEQRSLRSRLGGLSTSARHDTREITAPARRAFLDRFYEGLEDLPQPERDRRAEAARRLHFTRLAFRSSLTRSKRKAGPARDFGPASSEEGTADAQPSTS